MTTDNDFRQELSKLKSANEYQLLVKDKYLLYNEFIRTAIKAYEGADEFYKLGGTAYITHLHGEPIMEDWEDLNVFFKVPENIKIAFYVPIGMLGMSSDIHDNEHSYLSRDLGFKDVITQGPYYYQNIENNVPANFMDMNIYHEGQMVPNLILSFKFNLIINKKDDESSINLYQLNGYLKYNEDPMLCTSMVHYIYNMLIKHYISNPNPNPNPNPTAIKNTEFNLKDFDLSIYDIYFKPDEVHRSFTLIIYDMIFFNIKQNNIINNIFTPDGIKLISVEHKNMFAEIQSMAIKTINVLSRFDVNTILHKTSDNANKVYYCEYSISLSMDKYIKVIDEELHTYYKGHGKLKSGGNLYVFFSCRNYNKIYGYKRKNIISKPFAVTYITNIVNKYVSYLISLSHKFPKHKVYNKYTDILQVNHSFNHKICQFTTKGNKTTQKNNTLYEMIAYDISKDFMILLAISNIITFYNKYNNNIGNIKIALYNLFIKPRTRINPEDITNIMNIINHKLKKIVGTNLKNNTKAIDAIDAIYIEIMTYILKYYNHYIKWIVNNYVLIIVYQKAFTFITSDKLICYPDIKQIIVKLQS